MRLRTFFLLGALAFGGVGLLTISALLVTTWLAGGAAERMGHAIRGVHAAEEVQGALLTHNRESLLAGITGNPEHEERRKRARAELRVWLDSLDRQATDLEREIVEGVRRDIERYLDARAALDGNPPDPLGAYAEATGLVDRAYASIERLIDTNLHQATALQSQTGLQSRLALICGLAAAVLFLAMVAALLWTQRVFLYRPLAFLRNSLERLGGGDLSSEAVRAGPREVREIAEVFNDMAGTIRMQRQTQLRFVAAVAHELRNPLGAIKTSADLLLAASVELPEEKRREVLDVIGRQVSHLDRMVGDLLDTARIESGHLDLKKERCDLREICKQTVSLHEALSKGHRLRLDGPPEGIICECDPVRIGQVLNNLVSNAIKYTPHGGRIDVSLQREDSEAVVAVSDPGMGIAKEDLDRIFEPFRRTGATRETIPGVGLGLAVSRRIVEAHGGRIEVESEVDRGSTFRVRLPLGGRCATDGGWNGG